MTNQLKEVRLSDHDLEALKALFLVYFLPGDRLWLFGSRADLSKKGGDIDLYVETQADTIEQAMKMKSNFIWNLEQKIGEQKIDLVLNMLNHPCPLPIHTVALTEGVKIV